MPETPLRVLTPHEDEIVLPLAEQLPEVEFVRIPARRPLPDDATGEVLLCGTRGFPNLEAVVERGVRWIHSTGTGVHPPLLRAAVGRALTCSHGWSSIPIAEWVLATMLAFEKRLPGSWISEPPERWARADLGGLHGRTLGLVGIGTIGIEVARRALAFEMDVRAVRRSDAPSPLAGVALVPDLATLLPEAQHLVLAAPATPGTRHLLDRAALRQVRRGVHVVNVGRGSLIDHEALREALDEGRVGLASIDTPEPDPLPAGHWLYAHPRVRLSAHVSWNDPASNPRRFELFVENVRRYQAGEPLEGVVDLEHGY